MTCPQQDRWTLTRHPGDIITNGTGTTTTISGLPSGTYTFEVTDVNGCTSEVSSNAVIPPPPPIPAAPLIGTITNPTCISSTGSVALKRIACIRNMDINPFTRRALTRTGDGTTFTATTIPAGTYTYTVTNSYGCVSPASASLVIRDQPPTPAAPSAGNITRTHMHFGYRECSYEQVCRQTEPGLLPATREPVLLREVVQTEL